MFEKNRKNFGDIMENNSILVIYSGTAPVKRGDEFYDYAPQRNFFYMTGISRPNLVFMLKKDAKGEVKSRLYLERFDELTAKWDGAMLTEAEAKEASGIEDYSFIDELQNHIQRAFWRDKVTTVWLDLENLSLSAPNTPELDLAALIREKFPMINIKDAHPALATLRVIKAPQEIEHLQRAVDITNEAFETVLKNCRPGMMEYELEAHINYVFKKNGCKDRAFCTIMAAGKNACVLHYRDNDAPVADGDLVLLDFGAQWQNYSADITRTFPANGVFSERQKVLYNIVLGALNKVIEMIKPGVVFGTLNEAVLEHYGEELVKIGLISDKKDVDKYYFHGVAHMLGLETHDVGGNKELVLAPGMVFTVEPGLYLAEEGIGIRIEDDVLVTENGCKVLSGGIMKEIDEIEKFMAAAK